MTTTTGPQPHIVLQGPNGSGKTTTVQQMIGDQLAHDGRVYAFTPNESLGKLAATGLPVQVPGDTGQGSWCTPSLDFLLNAARMAVAEPGGNLLVVLDDPDPDLTVDQIANLVTILGATGDTGLRVLVATQDSENFPKMVRAALEETAILLRTPLPRGSRGAASPPQPAAPGAALDRGALSEALAVVGQAGRGRHTLIIGEAGMLLTHTLQSELAALPSGLLWAHTARPDRLRDVTAHLNTSHAELFVLIRQAAAVVVDRGDRQGRNAGTTADDTTILVLIDGAFDENTMTDWPAETVEDLQILLEYGPQWNVRAVITVPDRARVPALLLDHFEQRRATTRIVDLPALTWPENTETADRSRELDRLLREVRAWFEQRYQPGSHITLELPPEIAPGDFRCRVVPHHASTNA